MPQIGIWKRRIAADRDDFVYGIGDFQRTYLSEEAAREAFDELVEETNRYASRDPYRAYQRLVKSGNPLFQRRGNR